TGVVLVSGPLGQKRLELVRDLVPKASVVAMLANPLSPDAVPEIREVQAVAQANGLQLRMLNASTPEEIEAAFASLARQHPDALLVDHAPPGSFDPHLHEALEEGRTVEIEHARQGLDVERPGFEPLDPVPERLL